MGDKILGGSKWKGLSGAIKFNDSMNSTILPDNLKIRSFRHEKLCVDLDISKNETN
jgi:hypothetical protein